MATDKQTSKKKALGRGGSLGKTSPHRHKKTADSAKQVNETQQQGILQLQLVDWTKVKKLTTPEPLTEDSENMSRQQRRSMERKEKPKKTKREKEEEHEAKKSKK